MFHTRFLLSSLFFIIYLTDCSTMIKLKDLQFTNNHKNLEKVLMNTMGVGRDLISELKCLTSHFVCGNGECIDLSLKCDGTKNCADSSDEDPKVCNLSKNDTIKCNSDTHFDCGDNLCVPLSKVCDGISDCLKSNDESENECQHNDCWKDNGGCSQVCTKTQLGKVCSCKSGYVSNGTDLCIDINECEDIHSCSQICHNLDGSFKCSCTEGYEISTDNPKHCKAIEQNAFFIFSTKNGIKKMPLNEYIITEIVNETSTITLDFDYNNNSIFWNDLNKKKIYKASIYTKSPKIEILSNLNISAGGLALDWIYRRIYWTDLEKKTIEVAGIAGNMHMILINHDLGEPRAIVLDPKEGWIFWTDCGLEPKIERAWMDGTHRENIIFNNLKRPNDLTLDFVRKTIYWVDEIYNTITSCDYDGRNRKLILKSADDIKRTFSITEFENWIYLSDWITEKILKVEKLSGNIVKSKNLFNTKSTALHVYHPYRQPNGTNYCDREILCSHLCFVAPQIKIRKLRISCACPENLQLSSDGVTCEESSCNPSQFKCRSSICIPFDWVCDGDIDCNHGEDELNCLEHCDLDQFTCNSGKCIPLSWKCDGENNCDDNSDEKNCEEICDSINHFRCISTNTCYAIERECDGYSDCPDGSDEKRCPEDRKRNCAESEFECTDQTCIHRDYVCDGFNDCLYKEDEDIQMCLNITCRVDEFLCVKDKICINNIHRCSGTIQCSDGSDEKDCQIVVATHECNSTHDFLCGDGMCIPMSKVCDNITDCSDLSDEPKTCNHHVCSYDNGGCSQLCLKNSTRNHCGCYTGYQLRGMQICEDIDECKIAGSCSQECVNTIGSYSCLCLPGYSIDPYAQNSCRADFGIPNLIFNRKHDIIKVDLHYFRMSQIVRNTQSAGLDYDIKNNVIFWSDKAEKKLYRTSLDTVHETVEIVYDHPIYADDLAVDWIYNHIYWTNHMNQTIELSNLDGEFHIILIKLESIPRAIVLNPSEGWMFWTDWIHSKGSNIKRAGMDGSHQQTIAQSDLISPHGLTLDFIKKKVYWVDSGKSISSCDYDGKNRQLILELNHKTLQDAYSIAIFEDWMYWTDLHNGHIHRTNKFNGKKTETFGQKLGNVIVLRISHPYLQPNKTNHCSNSRCSHLCLPAPSFSLYSHVVSCACPKNFNLSLDKFTCILKKDTEKSNGSIIVVIVFTIFIAIGFLILFILFKKRYFHNCFKQNKSFKSTYHKRDGNHSVSLYEDR